jgi:hypothetical protein
MTRMMDDYKAKVGMRLSRSHGHGKEAQSRCQQEVDDGLGHDPGERNGAW